MRCWIAHHWGQWAVYSAHMRPGAIMIAMGMDKNAEWIETRQRRHCTRCGLTRDRLVAS